MKLPKLRKSRWHRTAGLLVIALGVLVLFMPILLGQWIIALLGIALIAAGLFQLVAIFRSADNTRTFLAYMAGVVTILLGLLLFLSPDLALSGLLIAVNLLFLADGVSKIWAAYKLKGPERWWGIFNGIFVITIAVFIWAFVRARFAIFAISVALGLRLVMQGWAMLFAQDVSIDSQATNPDTRHHPDRRLRIPASDTVRDMQDALLERRASATGQNVAWCLTLLAIFFAIHVFRTDAKWSFIGFISPFSATMGDAAVAVILAVALLLPVRLLWRKLSRPLERSAWHRFNHLSEQQAEATFFEQVLRYWLRMRMILALEMRDLRGSLNYAFWQLLRIGLPLTAILIAVNSIWGFSWYFNTENWASGVWQRITEKRVDVWRARMIEDVQASWVSKGVAADSIFKLEPAGVNNDGDFSFIVIGDTGEGDPSQMSLRNQIIAASKRENVKFLVVSSDVIYPDGKMKDYETNFYLPFMGFEKPIYAIPGNHDWFDANEGFNANFLDHDSAILALRARLASDLQTKVVTTNERFDEITREAQRLRQYYKIQNGVQKGPFFEIHTNGFSLIAIDTGILRTLDSKEEAWLESALSRAGKNYKMVISGHPFFVGGVYQGRNDEGFNKIYEVLKRYDVDIVMAGDTHDFEFYKVRYPSGDKQHETFHFVNGGGGAYLSIGTSLGFPEQPETPDYAFYPRTDELTTKIKNEAPIWKMPFLFWLRYLHGYPFDNEMVSGAFDFNRAPFFQSFVEVSVERSQKRVRFLLYGVNGQLRWRDIQVAGQVMPPGKGPDDFVEFIQPLHE